MLCGMNKPYKDAQNRVLWRDKTCLAHTQFIMSWKAFLFIINIIIVVVVIIIMLCESIAKHVLNQSPCSPK